MVAALASEAGIPDGVINVVQGMGDVGAALVTDDDVDGKVLHGGVENLFHRSAQTVDFVDKQNIAIG